MTALRLSRGPAFGIVAVAIGLAACGGNAEERSVTLAWDHPNVVSYWNGVANRTVNATSAVGITSEEQRPAYQADLATVHVAIYDATSAIDGRYRPYAVTPITPAGGASLEAAASTAAYRVLRTLFPGRGVQYEAAYEARIAGVPMGDAKTRGLAIGEEVAAGILALRANDGRMVAPAPYVSTTEPGRFRTASPQPFNHHVPFMRPFSLNRLDQFRPAGPPRLDSAAYAASLDETRVAGGMVSGVRTPEQLETARFHTEAPAVFVTRNLGRFAASTADVADAARLMAFIYVVHADAIGACFEAKYFYKTWRPLHAIPLADGDGNASTTADAAWTPVLPTPNHPEYPAAHSCTAGGLAETLRQVYGTRQVTYSFDSLVTRTTRTYAGIDALSEESRLARIHGGMHFDFSTTDGVALGTAVARWVGAHHFGPRL